jgi:hypothetical protein
MIDVQTSPIVCAMKHVRLPNLPSMCLNGPEAILSHLFKLPAEHRRRAAYTEDTETHAF